MSTKLLIMTKGHAKETTFIAVSRQSSGWFIIKQVSDFNP